MHKSILIMCLADPSGNPRPNRLIQALIEKGFKPDICSFPLKKPLGHGGRHYVIQPPSSSLLARLSRLLYKALRLFPFPAYFKNRLWVSFYKLKVVEKQLKLRRYDLIVSEDLLLLPLAFSIKNTAKILFDAREYYPRQEETLRFIFFEKRERLRLCQQYLSKLDKLVTVSPGLAQAYEKNFGVLATVVMSAPHYKPCSGLFERSANNIRLVYHGVANKNRKLEDLLAIVKGLDVRFTLDLYLVGSASYINSLKNEAQACSRIRILKPVPYHEINSMLSRYDIGLCYFKPTTFNLLHCLPNKFFEYVQARLAIFLGPSPDMKSLVDQYGCGLVCEAFSVPSAINAFHLLTAEHLLRLREKADLAAKRLCFEVEGQKLMDEMERLL